MGNLRYAVWLVGYDEKTGYPREEMVAAFVSHTQADEYCKWQSSKVGHPTFAIRDRAAETEASVSSPR